MRPFVLLLPLFLFTPALAAQLLLKPMPLSAACVKAGYTAFQDSSGTLRVLRYLRLVPDNAFGITQYYSAAGQLQSFKSSASGFAGELYNLTARVDVKGTVYDEKGYRSKLYTAPLKSVIRDAVAVRAGRCAS
jgi:hypothetical protein